VRDHAFAVFYLSLLCFYLWGLPHVSTSVRVTVNLTSPCMHVHHLHASTLECLHHLHACNLSAYITYIHKHLSAYTSYLHAHLKHLSTYSTPTRLQALPEAPNLPDKFTVLTTREDGGAYDMGKSSSVYSRRPCTLSCYHHV
jgi:hypothetical protein